MCEEMKTLVSRLAEYLRRSEQQLKSFHKYESQVEGWFKGELLCFLDREKREGRLHDFGLERQDHGGCNGMRVDIMLKFDNTYPSWVELKHLIKANFAPSQYFTLSKDRSDSYAYCVKRLLTISENSDKFMLVLFTPNPDSQKWNNCVWEFNNKFSPLSVRSLTNPGDYPEYFFLGLLHVPEGEDVAKDLDKSE